MRTYLNFPIVSNKYKFMDTSALLRPGVGRRCYQVCQPFVEAALGFSALRTMYDACVQEPFDAVEITQRSLDYLDIDVEFDEACCEKLRSIEGPLILAANHPFGGIEFFALVALMEKVRPGEWSFLANDLLCSIPGFEEKFIPLNPLARRPDARSRNRHGLQKAMLHLRNNGLLGLFPAGRVSYAEPRLGGAVVDSNWSPHLLRLAARTGATIACLHVPGSNSRRFLRIPFSWARLRALALCRELTSPPVSKVRIRFAGLLPPDAVKALAKKPGGSDLLRAICYLRADLDVVRPDTTGSDEGAMAPLMELPATGDIEAELQKLGAESDASLGRHGKFDLYWFQGKAAPTTLRALGIIREATFRAAGQGTGSACDLAEEDAYYHHLILWDGAQRQLAGAYRLGIVQEILNTSGPEGLYLGHVFHIQLKLYKLMGQAFELSRSFIVPEYQRDSQALSGLWKGLGIAAHRYQADTFFGSVTVSNAHHPATRAILVDYLRRNHADDAALQSLVRARNPFKPATRYHRLVTSAYQGQPIGKLGSLIDSIENGERGIPPLMRYYCGIGGKYLSFHVEQAFQDALYCLLRVDIAKIPESYRRRFIPAN